MFISPVEPHSHHDLCTNLPEDGNLVLSPLIGPTKRRSGLDRGTPCRPLTGDQDAAKYKRI